MLTIQIMSIKNEVLMYQKKYISTTSKMKTAVGLILIFASLFAGCRESLNTAAQTDINYGDNSETDC
jgi:hypothetical protein